MKRRIAKRKNKKTLGVQADRRIAREIAKYPKGKERSAAIAALAIAQEEFGWLTPAAMKEIADRLGLPLIAVAEIASFYRMFDTEPTGAYKITVCSSLPCELFEGMTGARYLQTELGIDFGQTTADGLITLVEGECMGACGDGPVILINNRHVQTKMTNDKIDILLKELKK